MSVGIRETGVARIVCNHSEDHQWNVQAIGVTAGQGKGRFLFVSETYRGKVEEKAIVWRRHRRGGLRMIVTVVVHLCHCRRHRSRDLAGCDGGGEWTL